MKLLTCVTIAALAALTAGPLSSAGTAVESADSLLRDAYSAAVHAELSLADGRTNEALTAYRKALDLYGLVQTNYPGWKAEVIGFRRVDCQNQIAAVEAGTLMAGPVTLAGASLPAAATNAATRVSQLVEELRLTWDALNSTPAGAGDQRLAQATELEIEGLTRTLKTTQAENEKLIRTVARLEAKTGKRGEKTDVSATAAPMLVPSVIKVEAKRLMENRDHDTALALLREASQLLPDDTDLTIQLAIAQCAAGQFAEAAALLKPLLRAGLTNAPAYITAGTAYMALGKIGDARLAMEQALKLNPQSANAHYNMAQIMVTLDPPLLEAAEAHYTQAVQLGSPADKDFENRLRMDILRAGMHGKKKKK